METTQFIDQVAAGKAAEAATTLNDLLSARAFSALEDRKVEIAKSAFGGVDNAEVEPTPEDELNVEVQDTADTPTDEQV